MAYNVLLQYVLPYNYNFLLLHCHDLKICLRIYWPSKMCIDHHLVLELTCGGETPLCYDNKLLTTKLQVIISSSLLSFSLCSPSTLWAWSRACLLLSYTLTRWPWYASSPVQDKTTPAAIACYINKFGTLTFFCSLGQHLFKRLKYLTKAFINSQPK